MVKTPVRLGSIAKYWLPAKTDELKGIIEIGKMERCVESGGENLSMRDTYSLPSILLKHGADMPPRVESSEASAETLVVNGTGVDGEQPHQQNQIPSSKHHSPNLNHR